MRDLLIIVVAPIGRDARLICDLLIRTGIDAVELPDCDAAAREAEEGVGALIIADEVLTPHSCTRLNAFISRQPSWSDVPVIVLTSGGEVTAYSEARRKIREPLGNLVLVEKPVRPETLVSTVKSAIRARRRQYEVRDHMQQERLASEALRRSEKLAVAGRLAASIAHEINNPLEAVTNLHYLIAKTDSLDEAKRYLASADQELARVVEIAKQTLRFHRESTRAAAVDVPAVLDSVLKLYERRMASTNIELRRSFDSPPTVMGFGGELRQLFANLISNALDAMPQGGKLIVSVEPSAERRNGCRQGVRVIVADTGSGIPAEVSGKMFEPFVSTKPETGTGLGLWVSSGIVAKHGGALRYKTRPGKGTVFSVFLPAEPADQS